MSQCQTGGGWGMRDISFTRHFSGIHDFLKFPTRWPNFKTSAQLTCCACSQNHDDTSTSILLLPSPGEIEVWRAHVSCWGIWTSSSPFASCICMLSLMQTFFSFTVLSSVTDPLFHSPHPPKVPAIWIILLGLHRICERHFSQTSQEGPESMNKYARWWLWLKPAQTNKTLFIFSPT